MTIGRYADILYNKYNNYEVSEVDLQTLLNKKQITKYHLSKISGIPKTTVTDICSGRSSLERCSAKTVQQLSKALDCSMEDLMQLDPPACNKTQTENGLPKNRNYLECGLPEFLQESVNVMKKAWKKADSGKTYLHLDCDYCNLQTDINNAEVNNVISSAQAWYLREKYLRIEREEIV